MSEGGAGASAHAATAEELARALRSDPTAGLTDEEAARRLVVDGPNELPRDGAVGVWRVLRVQFANVLVVILLVAITLSLFLGQALEAVAIAAITLFSILLGFAQELRAERSLEALRHRASPDATVVRSGRLRDIPSRELVPGDVVLLAAGDIVPADGRLIEAEGLRTDESSLTGESAAVSKSTESLPFDGALGDRKNMVFASTGVTHGRGRALVAATGAATEIGRIGELLRTVAPSATPLENELRRIGKALAWSAGGIVVLIAGLGLVQGRPPLEIVMFGISLAVAVVPEALPAVVTISLALGARRMVRRHALIRRLPAVETLGSVTTIGADKTGTLTTGEMTVREIYSDGRLVHVSGSGFEPQGTFFVEGRETPPGPPLVELVEAGALSTDAELVEDAVDHRWHVRGDPTEGALLVLAAKAGCAKSDVEARLPRIGEIPFSAERKRMTTLHESAQGPVAISKGALEVVLASCDLSDGERERIHRVAREMGGRSLRVLAVARRAGTDLAQAENGMTFLGLVGMLDPSRPEARAAIETCFAAGIRPVMITGDHPDTARAIARELHLLREGAIVTGADVDRMSDADLDRRVGDIDVYARVSPAHKLRVVAALQRKGEIVAMTGDGVNDAPALKKADVGVAMGITGTDVAKGAAAMILVDDNFASIVAAVEEGRTIFDNVKKYLMYLLSSNVGEILLMASAVALGLPLPLTAVQILYVNLATDGLPALALAFDPPERDLMRRRPRPAAEGIFSRPVTTLIVAGGVWSALVNVSLFAWALRSGRPTAEAVTMTFVSLVLIQFFKAYSFRSERASILERPFANRWLNAAVAWELVLLSLVVYVPVLSSAFGTFPLPVRDGSIVVLAAFTVVPVLEVMKRLVKRS